jgi:2-polyprenyl-3-methyl-5-hydroxy-6-metoxy-1,4-benzoquinol methylase
MHNTQRIDATLFVGQHYLGKPADAHDKIVTRRVELVRAIPKFCGVECSLADVGCGNGASMLLLAQDMKQCVGLEVYETHREEFALLQAAYNAENCSFETYNIEVTPYPGQFDRIICFEVIEHLERESSVRNIAAMLKPSGKAAFSVPNKWWVFETHGARLPRLLGLPWNRVPFFSWLPRFMHERFANARIYTKSRIRGVLEQSGFRVVEMKYITAPLDVLPDSGMKRFLTRTLFRRATTRIPFLSTSIFIVAERKANDS